MLSGAVQFEQAADLIREEDGVALQADRREASIQVWRKAYDAYRVHFQSVAVMNDRQLSQGQLDRARALTGRQLDVRISGTSDSPCVLISNEGGAFG